MTEIERIYTEFKDLSTKNMEVYQIDSLEVKVDASILVLKDGFLYVYCPVNNQNVFSAFRGNVHFMLKSDAEEAVRQFRNATNKDFFEDDYDEVFITDTRGLVNEVRSKFQKLDNYPEYKNIDVRMNKMSISDGSDLVLWDYIVEKIIEDNSKGFIRYCLLNNHNRIKVVNYSYDPERDRENFLHFIPANNKFKKSLSNNILFNKLEDYHKYGNIPAPVKILSTDVEKYDLDIEITRNKILVCDGSIFFNVRDGHSQWLKIEVGYLLNMKKFELEFVRDSNDYPLDHFLKEEYLWVKLPENVTDGKYQLKIKYQAPYIYTYHYTLNTTASHLFWFPYIPSETYFHANLKFTYPKKYNLFCVGDKISEEKVGKMKTAVWKTRQPVGHIDFSLGDCKQSVKTREGVPEVTVFMDKDRDDEVERLMNLMEIMSNILGKLESSKVSFIESYGYDIAIPDYVVFGFPELPANIGNPLYIKQLNNLLIAYPVVSVAELWWGKSVKPFRSNDSWLINSLAKITSILLIHKCDSSGEEIYNDNITLSNDSVREYYKASVSCGMLPDAVYDNNSGSRSTYVMHMLRYYLMNLQGKNDDVFLTILRNFYSEYKGKKASTKDFIRTVNSITGTDMSWFFDQWVYGNKLPEIEYDYSGTQENGVNYLNLEITQSGVGDNFISRIPLQVVYQNGAASTFNVDVIGKTYTKKLKLPMEMKELIFDPFNTVILKEKK